MPNWTNNTIEIHGTENDLANFISKCVGTRNKGTDYEISTLLDFNNFIPQPDNIFLGNLGIEEERKCKEEGIPTWYDWNVDNWDTKWNACDASYDWDGEESIKFYFDTAWSPPVKIFVAMVKQHPELSFQFLCEIEGVDYAASFSLFGTDFMCYYHNLCYVDADTDDPITWCEETNRFINEDGKEVDDWFSYVDWDNPNDSEIIAEIYEEDTEKA
jgi:hypothetical protein